MVKINHSKPFLDSDDANALREALDSSFLSNGPRAEKLADDAAERMGRKHALPVQSGTDALALALEAITIPKNAEVAVPAYICSAPLDALATLGIKPVPVDIDKHSLAMSADALPKKIDAAVAAHMFGIPAPLFEIDAPRLVEDCAQTLETSIDGHRVGSMGDASICSLYATKLLTSGHGGVAATSDPEIFDRMLELTTCDKMEEWSPRRHYRISDLNAALALSQFAKLDSMIKRRIQIAERYLAAMRQGHPTPGCVYSRFLVVPERPLEDMEKLFAAAGIEAKRPVYKPLYAYLGHDGADFPNAEWAWKNILSVPLYPALDEKEIERVETFLEKHSNELRRWPSA